MRMTTYQMYGRSSTSGALELTAAITIFAETVPMTAPAIMPSTTAASVIRIASMEIMRRSCLRDRPSERSIAFSRRRSLTDRVIVFATPMMEITTASMSITRVKVSMTVSSWSNVWRSCKPPVKELSGLARFSSVCRVTFSLLVSGDTARTRMTVSLPRAWLVTVRCDAFV